MSKLTRLTPTECSECGHQKIRVACDRNHEIIWDDNITWGTCPRCGHDELVVRPEEDDNA